MTDRDAIVEVPPGDSIERLPLGCCVLVDSAHTPTERMVPLLCGDSAKVDKYDNFNYYGSQLRIKIDMDFGLAQRNRKILRHPLTVRGDKRTHLIQVISRLHNYCITERLLEIDEIFPSREDTIEL
jgi:hypothetical protein